MWFALIWPLGQYRLRKKWAELCQRKQVHVQTHHWRQVVSKYYITLYESLPLTFSSIKPVFLCSYKGVRSNKSKLANLYIFHFLQGFIIIIFLCSTPAKYAGTADKNFQLFIKIPFNFCLFLNFFWKKQKRNRLSMKKLHLIAARLQHEVFFMNKYLLYDNFKNFVKVTCNTHPSIHMKSLGWDLGHFDF